MDHSAAEAALALHTVEAVAELKTSDLPSTLDPSSLVGDRISEALKAIENNDDDALNKIDLQGARSAVKKVGGRFALASELLEKASEMSLPPFTAILYGLKMICDYAEGACACQAAAAELTDRLLSLYPAIRALSANKDELTARIVLRLTDAVESCKKLLSKFVTPPDADWLAILKHKYQQLTTSPGEFDKCHAKISQLLQDATFAGMANVEPGMVVGPTLQQLRLAVHEELEDIAKELKESREADRAETKLLIEELQSSLKALTQDLSIVAQDIADSVFEKVHTAFEARFDRDNGRIPRGALKKSSEKPVARGRFGVVYIGLLEGEGPVALKVLYNPNTGPAEADRFRHVSYPHIAKCFGWSEEHSALVFELVKFPLDDRAMRDRFFTRESKLRVSFGVANGLKCLHGMDLVHGDVKPNNVMLSRRYGGAKLINFDSNNSPDALTATASVLNVPLLLSAPELMEGTNRRKTPASDIFSFGVLLFHVWSGETKWNDRAVAGIVEGLAAGQHAAATDILKVSEVAAKLESQFNIPPIIARMIEVCLAQEPNDRPTAQALVDQLWRKHEGTLLELPRNQWPRVLTGGAGAAAVTSTSEWPACYKTAVPENDLKVLVAAGWTELSFAFFDQEAIDEESSQLKALSLPGRRYLLDQAATIRATKNSKEADNAKAIAEAAAAEQKRLDEEAAAKKQQEKEAAAAAAASEKRARRLKDPAAAARADHALWAAAKEGNSVECARLVREDLADPNVPESDGAERGKRAVHYAAQHGHAETVAVLAKIGADPKAVLDDGTGAVELAADNGFSNVLLALKELGLDAKAQRTTDGATAVIYAARGGHADALRALVDLFGANVKAVLNCGRTALHSAAASGHATMCRMLAREFGLDVQAQTKGGLSALHCAAFAGHEEALRALLDLGADANAKDHEGKTPYVYATNADTPNSRRCAAVIDEFVAKRG